MVSTVNKETIPLQFGKETYLGLHPCTLLVQPHSFRRSYSRKVFTTLTVPRKIFFFITPPQLSPVGRAELKLKEHNEVKKVQKVTIPVISAMERRKQHQPQLSLVFASSVQCSSMRCHPQNGKCAISPSTREAKL